MDKQHELPSEIILEILSRTPLESLGRFRLVSKEWWKYIYDPNFAIDHSKQLKAVEEPTPIYFFRQPYFLSLHIVEQSSEQDAVIFKPRRDSFLKFKSNAYWEPPKLVGFFNGLFYISPDSNTLLAIHPLMKQCYMLPPLPKDTGVVRESCGIGLDASTNTLKMVCVYLKTEVYNGQEVRNHCTMVYVIGANSWREIPQVPSYSISGQAIFAHGCLYWLTYLANKGDDGFGRQVIWFDVRKEEFGLIIPPKSIWVQRFNGILDHLVDLNGELGFVCIETNEVWVLKNNVEWVLHCQIDGLSNDLKGIIKVLGCWNKKGDDILVTDTTYIKYSEWERFFVYNLKSGVLREIENFGGGEGGIIMYPQQFY